LFSLVLALISFSVLFYFVYRPWQARWGATSEEVNREMVGDEIVENPTFNATRAVTINAPAKEIWPWIVQIGYLRAGFYSYDRLDNDGIPSAEKLIPEFQNLKAGDVIPLDAETGAALFCDFSVAVSDVPIGVRDDHGAIVTRPAAEYARRGDIDRTEEDEHATLAAVRTYLGYHNSDSETGPEADDYHQIADIIPVNRRRPYDMRRVLVAFADEGSMLELQPTYGRSMLTVFARLNGRPIGVFANQPKSPLSGSIDAEAADKATRFIELCDAYGFPLISFIDNPGFMVGPQSEAEGMARHHARPLAALHHRSVPLCSVQIRKAYGLGPYAMYGWGTSHHAPLLKLAWPTVESGGMSLEGAAYLVKRKEIQAAETQEEALKIRNDYADRMRDTQSGLRAARGFLYDDVIEPAETRERISSMLARVPQRQKSTRPSAVDLR